MICFWVLDCIDVPGLLARWLTVEVPAVVVGRSLMVDEFEYVVDRGLEVWVYLVGPTGF